MSGKLNTDWDVESYRHAWDSDEQWDMRKQFILTHKDTIPEKRLVCLAQVYANIQILGCKYPAAVMTEVNELAKAVPGNKFEEKLKINREKKHFVKAKSSSGNFAVTKGKQGCTQSQSATPELKRKSPEKVSTEPIKEAKKPRVEKCDPVQPVADSAPMYGYYTSGYKSKMVSEDADYCGDPKVEADLKVSVENDSSKQIANLNKGEKAALGMTDRLGKKAKTRALVRQLEKRVQMLEKGLTESAKRTLNTKDEERRQSVDGNRELENRKFAWAGMLLKSFFADGKNVRKHTVSALEIAQLEFSDRMTTQQESETKIWICELILGGKLFSEGTGISQKAAKLSTFTCAMNKLFMMVDDNAIIPPDLDFFGLKLDMDDSTVDDAVLPERDRLLQAGKILAAFVTNNSNVVQMVCKIFSKLKLQIHLQTKASEKQYESTLRIGESLRTSAQAKTTEFSVLRVFRCAKKNLIDMVGVEMCTVPSEAGNVHDGEDTPSEAGNIQEADENGSLPKDGNFAPEPTEMPQEPQPPSPTKSSCSGGDEEERLLEAGRILLTLKTNAGNLTKVMNRTLKKFSLDIDLHTKIVKDKYKSYLRIGNSISTIGIASKENEKLATLIALRRARRKLVKKAQLADCSQPDESSPAIETTIKEQPVSPTLPLNLPSASVKLEDLNCDNMNTSLMEVGRLLETTETRRKTVVGVLKNALRKFKVPLKITDRRVGKKWEIQLCIGEAMVSAGRGKTKQQAQIQACINAKEKLIVKANINVCLSPKDSPVMKVNTDIPTIDNSNACSKIVVPQVEESQQKEQLLKAGKALQTCETDKKTVVMHVTNAFKKFNIQFQVITKRNERTGKWKNRLCIGGEMFAVSNCNHKEEATLRAFQRAKEKLIRMVEEGEKCLKPEERKSAVEDDSHNETAVPNGDVSSVHTKRKKRQIRKTLDEIQRLLQVGKKLRALTTDKDIMKVMRATLREFGFKVCIKKRMTKTQCKVFLNIGESVHTVGLAKKDKVVAAKKKAFLSAKAFLVSQANCDDCEVEPVHEDPLLTPTSSDAANQMIDLTRDESADLKPDISCLNANSHAAAEDLHDETERLLLVGRILMRHKLNKHNIFTIMPKTLKQFNLQINEQAYEFSTYCKVELRIGQSVYTVGIARPNNLSQARYQAYIHAKDQLVLMAGNSDQGSNLPQACGSAFGKQQTSKSTFPTRVNAETVATLLNVAHVKPVQSLADRTRGIMNPGTSLPKKSDHQVQSTKLLRMNFHKSSDQINVSANNQPPLRTFQPSQFVIVERPNCNPSQILHHSVEYCKVSIDHTFDDIPPNLKRCQVHVDGRKIAEVAKPATTSVRELRMEAEVKALEVLRTIAYTVKMKPLNDLIGMEITRDMLSKFVKAEACSSQETAIEDNNIGNRLLRLMGWKGGGLGKEGQQGIEEPIKTYNIRRGREGLGSIAENGSIGNDMDILKHILKGYACSKDTYWIKLSPEFTREERASFHSIAQELHLVSKSQGKDNARFMMVRRRSAMKGLKSMQILHKPSNDYEVIPPSTMRQ